MVSNVDQDLGITLDCFSNGRNVRHFWEKNRLDPMGKGYYCGLADDDRVYWTYGIFKAEGSLRPVISNGKTSFLKKPLNFHYKN